METNKSPVLSVTNAHFLGMLSMSGILPQLPLPVSVLPYMELKSNVWVTELSPGV